MESAINVIRIGFAMVLCLTHPVVLRVSGMRRGWIRLCGWTWDFREERWRGDGLRETRLFLYLERARVSVRGW